MYLVQAKLPFKPMISLNVLRTFLIEEMGRSPSIKTVIEATGAP